MRGTSAIKSNIGKHLEEYNLGTHLCSIYNTPQEQLSVIVPYIKIGLSRQEQCVYMMEDNAKDQIIKALSSAGIDALAEIESEALVLMTRDQAPQNIIGAGSSAMLDFLLDSAEKSKKKGFRGLRVLAEMTWAENGPKAGENLVEFETRLDKFFEKHDVSLICQYNRNRFPSEVIEEMIYIHPLIIFADMVCKNSYYIPPEEYLSSNSADHRVNQLLISMSVNEYLRQKGNN